MSGQQIIMNFARPPSQDDLQVIAAEVLETLPHELLEYVEDLVVEIEEFPDEVTQEQLDADDEFDILCFFKSGKQISPGVERKSSGDDDVLYLFRRPVLDMWCETCDDLFGAVRQVVVEEIARNFEFSDDDIEDMVARHHQGML